MRHDTLIRATMPSHAIDRYAAARKDAADYAAAAPCHYGYMNIYGTPLFARVDA